MRIRIAFWAVGLVFLFLALTLFGFEIIRGVYFRDLSNKNCIRIIPQEGSRGRILDRNGNVIAGNELCYDVMVMPHNTKHLDDVLLGVSGILGAKPQDLKSTFKENFIGSSAPVTLAQNIDIKKAITLEELKSQFEGIIIQPRPQRTYPYGQLACHVLGHLNEIDHWRLTKLKDFGYKVKDIVGFGGAEEMYDYVLRQQSGGMSLEVDHRGRFVRILGFRPPKSGKDIELTLDLKTQKIAETILKQKGCVIIMDPASGEIFSMVSNPGFCPCAFIKKSDASLHALFNSTDAPLINRAISGLYPAGSVFKPVVAAAAMQLGKISPSTTVSCGGAIHIGNQEFSCWDTHREQNLLDAITHSCNVFFYRAGLLSGPQAIHGWALKFGFGKNTGIDLPYEESGIVPSVLWRRIYRLKNWFDGDTANLSIGQGELLVTPLQISRMMALFANEGNLVTPYTVKTIDGRDICVYQRKVVKLRLKKDTLDYIREALRKAVLEPTGTANALAGLSVSVAGKTGTAQVSNGQPHAWFAGFFPFENPRFVICVFLEHGGSGYRAVVAAKKIIEAMLKEGLI